jgi:hypothetical protein
VLPEDTLTSGVFGLLTVLPPACLAAWLRHARNIDGAHLDVPGVDRINAAFWPQLLAQGGGTCEPDALLALRSRDSTVLVLVEVKYHSDMSGWPSPEEEPTIGSQLGREWLALLATPRNQVPGPPATPDRRVLVYISPAAVVPTDTFRVVAEELEKKTGGAGPFLANTYWLSWFTLAGLVSDWLAEASALDHERVALERVLDQLRVRRLVAFEGLPPPRKIEPVPWSYKRAVSSYAPHAPPKQPPVAWAYDESRARRMIMNDASTTPWQALFDEYQRVVKGAGELLRDADRLMAQRGFDSANPQNTAGSEGTLHMEAPEKWVAGWFVRFYRSERRPTESPYVAVFLHDRGGNDDFDIKGERLREPLVIAGVIRSATNSSCTCNFWHAKYWFWNDGTPDGPVVTCDIKDRKKDGQASHEAFGVRLERIGGLCETPSSRKSWRARALTASRCACAGAIRRTICGKPNSA